MIIPNCVGQGREEMLELIYSLKELEINLNANDVRWTTDECHFCLATGRVLFLVLKVKEAVLK